MELNLAVRAHDLAEKKTPEELAEIVSAYGFRSIQLVFGKAFDAPSYEDAYVARIKKALDNKGISVSMLGGYFNPVHSHPDVVQKGVETFFENLRIAHFFGNAYVGTETGSFNDSPWTYVPKNHTEEGYQATKKVLRELALYAEKVRGEVLFEPAWGHVIYSTSVLDRLVKELHSPAVHVTIDLFNLLYEGNFEKRDEVFLEALKTFKTEIKVIHLKDAKIIDGKMIQLAPGEGDFHFGPMLQAIKEYCPSAILTFEGVKADKIRSSLAFIKSLS